IANSVTPVALGINTNVNGTLTLTSNLNTTASFTFTRNNALPTAGSGDVIGNVKRSNSGLALPISTIYTFGNPFNTLTFDSGVTPTDVTFNLVLSAPVGFPGTAVTRTYTISLTGGGVFLATLQLHYLDLELNGNNETNLKLWR